MVLPVAVVAVVAVVVVKVVVVIVVAVTVVVVAAVVLVDVWCVKIGVMTALDFAIPELFNEFSCAAAFDCWPLTLLDCTRALQAWMPSCHV